MQVVDEGLQLGGGIPAAKSSDVTGKRLCAIAPAGLAAVVGGTAKPDGMTPSPWQEVCTASEAMAVSTPEVARAFRGTLDATTSDADRRATVNAASLFDVYSKAAGRARDIFCATARSREESR
jgi:hypothetical protein